MAFVDGNSSDKCMSTREIMESLDDNILLSNFFPDITKVPCKVCAPYRDDKHPSLYFYSKNGKILFKDHAKGNQGSLIDLLSLCWRTDFTETVHTIADRLGLDGNRINLMRGVRKVKVTTERATLKVRTRQWRDYDWEYWSSYGVAKDLLLASDVYPVEYIIYNKGEADFYYAADKYAYGYVERKEGHISIKVYQPFNKDGRKWQGTHDKSVLSLWNLMPESGELLVICSSLKDALCLRSQTGIPTISPQGEGYPISETALKVIKSRFKRVVILFDNDEAGIEDAKKLSATTGLEWILLPDYGAKDISDYYKSLLDKSEFRNTMFNLINKKDEKTSKTDSCLC